MMNTKKNPLEGLAADEVEGHLQLAAAAMQTAGYGDMDASHLHRIEAMSAVLTAAQEQLRRDVMMAHELGHSWAEIGAILGVSRQSAHERFSE